MFRKKPEKPKRNHAGKSLSQYGLFDVPTDLDTGLNNMDDNDEGDSDLEAELAALSGTNEPKPKPKPVKLAVPQEELDRMVAESLRDEPDDEEDVSGDEDDPDLLNELQEIAGSDNEDINKSPEKENVDPPSGSVVDSTVTLLKERLKLYEIAEENAKKSGESSKVRRFGRALKTIKGLLKDAEAGKDVNMDDIPPEVSIAPKKEPPKPQSDIPSTDSAPDQSSNDNLNKEEQNVETTVASTSVVDSEVLNALLERQKQYKIAALRSKKAGDQVTAIAHLKIVKQFDAVIEAVKNGQSFDLSQMPGPPTETAASPPPEAKPEQQESQQNIPEIPMPQEEVPEETLIQASSVLEALEQRLAVYKEQETKAKEQGNASKARRLGRIIKQFNDAIKLHKAGKPIPVDELPTPPGYGPIPVEGGAKSEPPKPAPAPAPAPVAPKSSNDDAGEASSSGGQTSRISGNHITTSRAEKQVLILLAKQKQFKLAALNAKKKGELNEAKEFLRNAKRLDKLIEASRGGLPIDWSSIPISPEAKSQLDNEYDVVMAEECDEKTSEDLDILSRLENQLSKQLKMCLTTRDHHKNLGDVAGANRFERLALNVTKDLDVVRVAHRTNGKVPKFHYENKDFSIVKSFTELTDNDLELTILRGINYTTQYPKDIDTYVKFEFPFPQDTPYSDRTSTVKNTNNPEYNSTYVIPIQRTSRNCQRVFKRHGIKFEVYSKGWCASNIFCCFSGFFRSDTLIGTVNVKLQPLETQCELHDSFDLLEGRKKVGGKLEVRLRVRQPCGCIS